MACSASAPLDEPPVLIPAAHRGGGRSVSGFGSGQRPGQGRPGRAGARAGEEGVVELAGPSRSQRLGPAALDEVEQVGAGVPGWVPRTSGCRGPGEERVEFGLELRA